MFSKRTLHRIFRGARLTLPLVFWTFTAAPSFVDSSSNDSIQLAGYSGAQGRSGSLAGRLFENETYRPVIDTAVEDIYTALSKHDLDRALNLTNRLLEEFPNFYQLKHLNIFFRQRKCIVQTALNNFDISANLLLHISVALS